MSTPEGAAPEHAAGGFDGVKRLLGKKVAGVPVIFLVLAAAAVGLYVLHKRGSSTTATDATGSAGDPTDSYIGGSDVPDPGGVSGLGGSSGGYQGGGSGGSVGSGGEQPGLPLQDPSAGIDTQALSEGIAEGISAGFAGIEFPGGNPHSASPAPDPTQRLPRSDPHDKRRSPAKSRGGQAVAVPAKGHPVVAGRGKAKPAATKPAKPPAKSPSRKPAGGARPAAKPSAPHAPAKSASGKPTRPHR